MRNGPLHGVKVLDFSQVLAAPFCGMLLADMGAEIIKVEKPGYGDISREYGPYVNDVSLYFCQYNRGKKSIAVDMRSEEGKAVIMDLVQQADVVIENFKAGTLDKLGLGYEAMRKQNTGIIYGSICGFGTYGPLSHLPCMDIIAAARSGLIDRSGPEGAAPIKPGFSMCDTWAGLHLLRGLSMALLKKQRTGEGSRVDIAMLDCAFYMCEWPVLEHSITGKFMPKTGNHDPLFAPSGEFSTRDGQIVFSVTTEDQWKILCHVLRVPELINEHRFADNTMRLANCEALVAELDKACQNFGRYELERLLSAAGIVASAVQTLAEFARHPQTQELGIIMKAKQPGVGEYLAVNTPIYFSKTPVFSDKPAAGQPGDNSLEVLQSLGYESGKIKTLLGAGVVHQAVKAL